MSELVVAFSDGSRSILGTAGWHKHTGDVFTRELRDGTLAWLGLNRATKRPPLEVCPVGGVRHDATMRLCDELGGGKRYVAATLSEPLAYLGATRVPDLAIEKPADVERAGEQLLHLVETRLMPFAESYADTEQQLEALRLRQHLAVPESAIIRRPAMLAVLDRTDEAITSLDQELATLGNRTDQAAEHYRSLGIALRDWIDGHR